MEGDCVDLPTTNGNKLFHLLKNAPHLFIDFVRRLDADTFGSLKSTCPELSEKCDAAERYVTYEINSIQLENNEFKLFLGFGIPAPQKVVDSRFAYNINSIRLINGCTDEELDKILAYFGTRTVTAKELYPGKICCNLNKLGAFIKKYAIEDLVINGDIPLELVQDPIIKQVKELMLDKRIDCDADFLLNTNLNRCHITFQRFVPNWIVRQILEQLIENKRQLDFWELERYNPENLQALFDGWKIVSPWDEDLETDRPLIVKHDDMEWTVICLDHAAYKVKYDGSHLRIEERNEYEGLSNLSELNEDFSNEDYDVEDFEEYENDFYDEDDSFGVPYDT